MMGAEKFWETMNLLVGHEFRKTGKEMMDEVQDWVERIVAKKVLDLDLPSAPSRKNDGSTSGYGTYESSEKDVEEFCKAIDLIKIECKFCHPQVRSRLEKLMGSNLVSLTDREYMQRLQQRILEDYAESMDKRIKHRENEEMERVKNLVLTGKIPISEAPASMAQHPIMLIEKYCNKLIIDRRAKIKIPQVHIPPHIYFDDTRDPPSGLSIENGHVFRKSSERLCLPIQRFLPEPKPEERGETDTISRSIKDEPIVSQPTTTKSPKEEPKETKEKELPVEGKKDKKGKVEQILAPEEVEEEEEEVDPHMYRQADYDRYRYESPLIKELRSCETVEQMYELADQIIGILQTLDTDRGRGDDRSTVSKFSTVTNVSESAA